MTDNTWKLGFLGTQVEGMNFHLHERKYELDSICAVVKLSYAFYKTTNSTNIFTGDWKKAMLSIVDVIRDQQKGSDEGPMRYFFQRETYVPTDTLMFGNGPPAKRTGMSKSPFRPSDDASTLPFPIGANAMAVVSLNQLAEMLNAVGDTDNANDATSLANEIKNGIAKYGTLQHPVHGLIYAFEVDGFGSGYAMDDANIPSLLSLPYLGFCDKSDPLYLNTRTFLLSNSNPYFFQGSAGEGIGGPHVGLGHIWPMSIIIRALTSSDDQEIMQCLQTIKASSAGTGFLHESFWKDDVTSFTRVWFAWVNSLFGELILTLAKEKPYLIFN